MQLVAGGSGDSVARLHTDLPWGRRAHNGQVLGDETFLLGPAKETFTHVVSQATRRGMQEALPHRDAVPRCHALHTCARSGTRFRCAHGLSGSPFPSRVAAARTATSPPSSPACVTAATSLCPSIRAAVSSREAAWTSAWGPQVRCLGTAARWGKPACPPSVSAQRSASQGAATPSSLGRRPGRPVRRWEEARPASHPLGGAPCDGNCVNPSRQLGRRVDVVWLLLNGLGVAEATASHSSQEQRKEDRTEGCAGPTHSETCAWRCHAWHPRSPGLSPERRGWGEGAGPGAQRTGPLEDGRVEHS